MLTEDEFKKRWKRTTKMQKKFILRYIENGFDPNEAAVYAGYTGVSLSCPLYRVQRKVNDIIDYLIAKNNLISTIVKPTWIMQEYKKLYDGTHSEITKVNVLRELSKILQMQSDAAKVEVNNTLAPTPVQIVFNDED